MQVFTYSYIPKYISYYLFILSQTSLVLIKSIKNTSVLSQTGSSLNYFSFESKVVEYIEHRRCRLYFSWALEMAARGRGTGYIGVLGTLGENLSKLQELN